MGNEYKRKSGFSGTIGAEFDAIWEAIQRNKVIPAAKQRVSKTTNGTIIEPLSEVSEGESTTTTNGVGSDEIKLLRVTSLPEAPYVGSKYYSNGGNGDFYYPFKHGIGRLVLMKPDANNHAHYEDVTGNDVLFYPPPISLKTCQTYSPPTDSVVAIHCAEGSGPNSNCTTGYSAAKGNWYWPNPEYYYTNGISTNWHFENSWVSDEIIMVRDLALIVPSYEEYLPITTPNTMYWLTSHNDDAVTAEMANINIWEWS